jgi:hypothetical protein
MGMNACLPAGREVYLRLSVLGTGFQHDKHGMPPLSGGGFTNCSYDDVWAGRSDA